ncbi:MAG: fused MFS/spermidine synthase [Propionivibrio sp.]|uniref:Fused MFS/spermidine synthase n=1 Tax=Candidatus Propionivibrio dominans TaxID=2954373 RepID=A0A9D7IAE7_9RHOO|nr:fused MFS/spermidine synthase [Candidatus Propionivibrio dominans]
MLNPLSRPLLFAVVFIEGFSSLGAEVIALRQIIPHMGSSIVVTAPTIGFFLLALALGYHTGAKVAGNYLALVARNFLIAAALAGAGLAGVTVDLIFAAISLPLLAYLVFIAAVLCPLAWLLGQTVPILTNLMQHQRTGEASGYALYYSTLGSFLASLLLSLLIMQWLGVSAAVALCALLLLVGAALLSARNWRTALAALAVIALTLVCTTWTRPEIETAYASYTVTPVDIKGAINPRAFKNNNSLASLIDEGEPRHYTRYVHHIRRILLEDLAFRERRILVLGAGGFTLSHREPDNHYTYVDIDPAIRRIAEEKFLGEAALGEFIVDDARHFVASSERRFDAVVVDVYSAHSSIPGHLVTREFWQGTRRVLTAEGVMIANLILDSRLDTPYARNLLATIESIYGRCAVEVLHRTQPLSNVIVICHNGNRPRETSLYVDERNAVDFDRLRSR